MRLPRIKAIVVTHLDVGEDGDPVIDAELLPVSHEASGAGIHQPFVGHVAEHETLGSDELD